MSDTTEKSNDKGFHINGRGVSCIPCRCKRQFYHKETKTVKEGDKTTIDTVVDKRNTKFGSSGRHMSPDDIFKPETYLQAGSVEICDTGFGMGRKPTPEENQERIFKLETDVEEIKKDIDDVKNFKFKME